MKNVLIITSCSEHSNGAGSIFLKNIFSNCDYDWVNINDILEKKNSFLNRFLYRKIDFFKKNGSIAIDYLKQNFPLDNYQRVVITLSDLSLIMLASNFILNEKVRFICWDDYRYLSKNQKLKKSDFDNLVIVFEKIMHEAKYVSVMGQNMAEEYKIDPKRYVVIRNTAEVKKNKIQENQLKYINIVFCGSLYAKKEWNAFIKTLVKNDFLVDGVRINVHFLGNYPKTKVIYNKKINYHGFKIGNELNEIMKSMHIGYMPYWIDESYSLVAKTSFPSKLSFYLESNLFIFNHSPSYSEANKIIDKYNIGVNCNSLDQDIIYESLRQMVNNLFSENNISNIENCIKNELSAKIMSSRLEQLLK